MPNEDKWTRGEKFKKFIDDWLASIGGDPQKDDDALSALASHADVLAGVAEGDAINGIHSWEEHGSPDYLDGLQRRERYVALRDAARERRKRLQAERREVEG